VIDGFRWDNNIVMEIKGKDVGVGMENTHARKGEVSYIKLQVITVLKES
jgi:hypothetical protein